MTTIRNIIFDFDGTLVDTAPLIIATIQATIAELGLEAHTDAECRATIGLRLEDVPSVLWPANEVAARDFAGTYRRIFAEHVKQFGIEDYFDMLIGGNDVEHGKPSAEPVVKILQACGWSANETLTVGDAAVDIMMGHAAGTATCAVTYGNGQRAELSSAAPTLMIDTFDSLTNVLLNKMVCD